jgi:hypothetical protein
MLVGSLKCGPALIDSNEDRSVNLGITMKSISTRTEPQSRPLLVEIFRSDQSPTAQTQGATPVAELLHLHMRQYMAVLETDASSPCIEVSEVESSPSSLFNIPD